MRRRRVLTAKQRRRFAQQLTAGVLLLNVAFYLTCLGTAPPVPAQVGLFQLLWAAGHRPSFYLLLLMLSAGPALTLIAWQIRGRHRWWLITTWTASAMMMTLVFSARITLMLKILWWRYSGG